MGHRGDVHQSVLVDPNINEGAERGHIRHDTSRTMPGFRSSSFSTPSRKVNRISLVSRFRKARFWCLNAAPLGTDRSPTLGRSSRQPGGRGAIKKFEINPVHPTPILVCRWLDLTLCQCKRLVAADTSSCRLISSSNSLKASLAGNITCVGLCSALLVQQGFDASMTARGSRSSR
jgi:hypothetical protein